MPCTVLGEVSVTGNSAEWPNTSVCGDANIFNYNGKLYTVIWHSIEVGNIGQVGHIYRSLDNGATWQNIASFESAAGFFPPQNPSVRIYGTVLYIICFDHTRVTTTNQVVGGFTNQNYAFKIVSFDLSTEVLTDPFILGPDNFWVFLTDANTDFVFRGSDIVILTHRQVYGICVDMGGIPTEITTQLWMYTRVAGVWSSTDITLAILGAGFEGYRVYDTILDAMQIGPSGVVNVFFHKVTDYTVGQPLCTYTAAGDNGNCNLHMFQIMNDNSIANLQVVEQIFTHNVADNLVYNKITSNLFWDSASSQFIMTYLGRIGNISGTITNMGDLKILAFADLANPFLSKATCVTGAFSAAQGTSTYANMRITNQSGNYLVHYTDPYALVGASNNGKIWRISATSIGALVGATPILVWTHIGAGNDLAPVVPQQYVLVAGSPNLCYDFIGFGTTAPNGTGNPPGPFRVLNVSMPPPLPGPTPGPIVNPIGCPDVI